MRAIVYLAAIMILFSGVYFSPTASFPMGSKDIKILDVHVPDIIIKSNSKFKVSIELINNGYRTRIVTVYIFLETFGTLIKSKVKVYHQTIKIKPGEQKMVDIVCKTPKMDWWKLLLKKTRVTPQDKLFYSSRLGIKIIEGCHCQPTIHRPNKVIFKKWYKIKLVEPIIYNPDLYPININWCYIPESTDANGSFIVGINVSNSYHEKMPICIAVYIATGGTWEYILQSILRWYREVYYIVGFHIENLSENAFINVSINCSFPKENLQVGQYYDVIIIVYSYLPLNNNKNMLGNHIVWLDAHVYTPKEEYNAYPEEVKKFWKKLGNNVTFCALDAPRYTFACAPRVSGKIFYSGTNYLIECINERMTEKIEDVKKEIKKTIPLVYLLLLSIVAIGIFGYWKVKKYFEEK